MPLSAASGAISACVFGGGMLASDAEWNASNDAPMIPSAMASEMAGARREQSDAGMSSSGCVRNCRSCGHLRENSQRHESVRPRAAARYCCPRDSRRFVSRASAPRRDWRKLASSRKSGRSVNMGAAQQQFLDGALEPDQRGAAFAQQREIVRLGDRASAERNDARLLLSRLRRRRARDVRFRCGGIRVRRAREKISGMVRPAASVMRLSRSMLPAELAGEQAGDGGLAAAHESGKADERRGECRWSSVVSIECELLANGGRDQSRFRMLIVPSKELSSTLARPELKVPNSALPNFGKKGGGARRA